MAGFGRSQFGVGPFGFSDLGFDLCIEAFEPEYFDPSIVLSPGETVTRNNKDPLLMYLRTMDTLVNRRREDIDNMHTMLDYETIPLQFIQLWGEMLGLGIDKNDPEFLQRSFLGNASQWLQIKSTVQGYSVRGLASRFNVFIDNYWRIDPMWAPFIPPRHLFLLKPPEADAGAVRILHTDSPPGTWPGTPTSEVPSYAKASYIKVIFEIADPRIPNYDYNTALDLVISKIREVVAIHHEIQSPEFRVHMQLSIPYNVSIQQIEEKSIDDVNVWDRYDIVAADVVETDHGYPLMDMIPSSTTGGTFSINFSISNSMEIQEEWTETVNESAYNLSLDTWSEQSTDNVNFWDHYDIVDGDEVPVDSGYPLMDMTVIVGP